jgi:hypothetical protein
VVYKEKRCGTCHALRSAKGGTRSATVEKLDVMRSSRDGILQPQWKRFGRGGSRPILGGNGRPDRLSARRGRAPAGRAKNPEPGQPALRTQPGGTRSNGRQTPCGILDLPLIVAGGLLAANRAGSATSQSAWPIAQGTICDKWWKVAGASEPKGTVSGRPTQHATERDGAAGVPRWTQRATARAAGTRYGLPGTGGAAQKKTVGARPFLGDRTSPSTTPSCLPTRRHR